MIDTNNLPGALPTDPALQGNSSYLCYDQNGRILSRCSIAESTRLHMQAAGALLIESDADPTTNYVKDGAVTPRPTCPAQIDGMTISGLPVPSKIQIDTSIYDCDDDHVDLSFDRPGAQLVRVICWPYLDKEFSVETTSQ